MDVLVKGSKGKAKLNKVVVDTGATYSFLQERILHKIGAFRFPTTVPIELGDGKKVRGKAYGVVMKFKEREAPTTVVTFKGAKSVIGVEALEALGLKIDPTIGKLESTRPKGLAYFY